MKITGTGVGRQDLVDGVDAGTAVGQLDVGQHHLRPRLVEQRRRLGMGARRADDAMAKALDHLLDVHGDQRLVLDDQDVGRHLARNLVAGLRQQRGELLFGRRRGFRPPPRR